MVARKLPEFVPDPRYWTDWQLARHLGCTPNTMHRKISKLDGFPKKDPDFGWDSVAVEAYLNRRSGLTVAYNEEYDGSHSVDDICDGLNRTSLREFIHQQG